MITKLGGTLVKEAVTRWKDFIQNMGKNEYVRLMGSGIVKPEDTYINGINRGTVNIMRRYGITRGNLLQITALIRCNYYSGSS